MDIIPNKYNQELPKFDDDPAREMFSMIQHTAYELARKGTVEMDMVITEGLKRKGFEFENNFEIEQFIRERCKMTINEETEERILYVDDIPFLLIILKNDISFDYTDKTTTVTADYCRYKFIE